MTSDDQVAAIVATCPRIDALVNCAGMIQRGGKEFEIDAFRLTIEVNLNGTMRMCLAAKDKLAAKGGDKAGGGIVNIASMLTFHGSAFAPGYAASKGGVMLMMRSIAQEVAPYRIRVNAISPGAIRTPINTAAWETPEAYADLMRLVPYKRIGEAEDIARAAVWLASDEADYVTGATLYIDGGMTLYPGFATGG